MLRLTIEGNEIELYENEPINLSYQFSNLQEINASASSFSQTFRVPLTKKNQDYFGAVNEFGLITTWDPKTKASAELTSSTIPIMRGFIQVKYIYIDTCKHVCWHMHIQDVDTFYVAHTHRTLHICIHVYILENVLHI